MSMAPDQEQSINLADPFEIGVYALEVVIVGATIYAIMALPMWLKPLTP
jgi:hypothetical protein